MNAQATHPPIPTRNFARLALSLALLSALPVAHASTDNAGGNTKSKAITSFTGSYRILAAETEGGGDDELSDNISQTLNTTKISKNVTVYNVPGDDGVTGLKTFAKQRGNPNQLMVLGPNALSALALAKNPGVSLNDLTPIARLTDDYEVIVVEPASPYHTLNDLIAAFKKKPNMKFGGAAIGSTGQIFTTSLLRAGGYKGPVNWVPSSGNLQGINALLQGETDVASVSMSVASSQIMTGRVRALGTSAAGPTPGVTIPNALSQGVKAQLTNWRGVFAPAGLSADQKAKLSSDFMALSRSGEWHDLLTADHQNSFYQNSLEFTFFLKNETSRIKGLLSSLNLTP